MGIRRARRVRPLLLDGERMSLEQVEAIADGHACALASRARHRVLASRRAVLRAIRRGGSVYGVNTGFGHLAQVRIEDRHLDELQRNLVRSHCAGVGEPLTERVVRAVLALRVNCLARGHSGVKLETVEIMLRMLAAGITPVVPEQGSVGASGDLAPLAHVALTLMGEGETFRRGVREKAATALARARIRPLRLEAKEGIALINGTQVMCAIGVLAVLRAERLAVLADVTGAMSLEALRGSHRAFDRRVHRARPHPGQLVSAANLRTVLAESAIERSHAECDRVQDAYSLRCIPQVHGAARDALAYARRVLAIEINASSDNPMVMPDGDLISGGNFHGQGVAMALDHLGVAASVLATISERRIERLLNPDLSGLPAFLARDPGLNSGFMMAQVTAAALVSENKVLAHPASVDSIPTSAAKEDHVPMGAHAARKAARIVDHLATVLAIEALCAAQALDFLLPLRAGAGVEAARRALRRTIRPMHVDRVLSDDILRARRIVDDETLRRAAEKKVGPLR